MAAGKRDAYPLQALLELREREVEDGAAELARAVAERERAAEERRAAEGERRRAEDEDRRVRASIGGALLRGELRVADLAQADAWEKGASARHAALSARVDRATDGERAAVEEEGTSRVRLAERQAAADVVDKDRSRHIERVRKRIEAKEEEFASEAWRKR